MLRILFAEDAPTAMDLAGGLLDDSDLELDVATDGRGVLERLNAAPSAYALVILAYDLPEISGLECITYIRQMFRALPILVLSETLDAERLDGLAALGVRKKYVFSKPLSRQAFADRVRQTLAEIPPKRPPIGSGS